MNCFIRSILLVLLISNIVLSQSEYNRIPNTSKTNVFPHTIIANGDSILDITLPYLYDRDVHWIDYDNDRDMDLAISGISDNGRTMFLLKNDNGSFNEVVLSCSTRNQSEFRWIDYNNDNKIDLVIGVEYGSLIIYINEGNGQFTSRTVALDFSFIWDCAWIDFDNDGDLDLMYSGREGGDDKVQFFRNDGNDLFVESWKFPYLRSNHFDWGDYNNDGYKDLLMLSTVDSYGKTAFSLYTNDGDGTFTETKLDDKIESGWYFKWIDFDNDGYQDIIMTGSDDDMAVKIYKNQNGADTFSKASIFVYNMSIHNLKYGDYNNNGNLDFLLIGRNENNDYAAKLFYNQDGESFIDSGHNFPDIINGQADLGDFDHDGDLDIVLMSEESEYYSIEPFIKIYKNQLSIDNHQPASPTNLISTIAGDQVTLSWNKSTDDETPSDALSYNVRIGISSGSTDILSPLSMSADGLRIIPELGNTLYSANLPIHNLLRGQYYWSVQAVDQAYNASQFSEEDSFFVSESGEQQYVDIEAGLQGLVYSDAAFGDYDADGDLDLLVSGRSSYVNSVTEHSIIYCNDDGIFTNINANITGVTYSAVSWGDFNNDGRLDLAIAGQDSNDFIRTDIYKNLGNNQFANINAGIIGLIKASLAWGDYDNDGDLDLLVSGKRTHSGLTATRLYKNDGNDIFVNIYININTIGKVAWADYDKDGDLDLSIAAKLYKNEGNNQFKDSGYDFVEQKSWQQSGPIIWGDYDSDGDLDILAERTIFRNDGGIFIKQITFEDIGSFGTGSSVFGDMDNDGDLDVLLAGQRNGYSTPAIRYVKNEGNGTFSNSPINIVGARSGKVAVGDYDNDGDLDVLLTGESDLGMICKLYRNGGLATNEIPTAPNNLSEQIGNGIVCLKWSESTDTETPDKGLTYNIRISSHLDSSDIKSPAADLTTGYRFVAAIGNVNQSLEWPFHSKKSGTYFFSLQAIDNNYAGSAFSEAKQFTIPNSHPTAFNLLSPLDNDTLDYYQIPFKWSKSVDYFSDTLAYSLKIFSAQNDTLITNLKDTTYNFDGIDWIFPGLKYQWLVLANDDKHTTSSIDTFSLVKRKLESGILLDSMFVYITHQKDSAAFYDNQDRLIMKLFWEEGALENGNDTLIIGLKSEQLIPPSTAAGNYSLSNPILIGPKNLESIAFKSGKVKVRLYADTTIFRLSEIESHIKVSEIDEAKSIFDDVNHFDVNDHDDWVEFEPALFKRHNLYTVTAINILMGDVFSNTYKPEIAADILIPVRKSATLNGGIQWQANSSSKMTVRGNLNCEGNRDQPVILNNISIYVSGKSDTIFHNNVQMADCNWLTAKYINVNAAKANITHSRFAAISANNYATVFVNHTDIYTARSNTSKLNINESTFDSTGYFTSTNSIVKILNSEFKYYSYKSSHQNSYILLEKNKINADAFLEPRDCFLVYNGNLLIKAGDPDDYHNRVGIAVYSGNYAIIHNNIISGFRSGIEVGYDNEAVIFNNTFVNNDHGVRLYATPDTVSIYNNIFYNQYIAIDLNFSTYSGGTNVSYINNNLWKERNPNHVVPYIDNRADHSNVIGNSISYHADPLFEDMVSYRLAVSSPAIDKGLATIPSFNYSFSILDTIIHVEGSIQLTNYFGPAPDLGAREFDGTDINDIVYMPLKFKLFQNYPNPFNPETTIKLTLPKSQFATIQIYNILGEEVKTLLSKKLSSGLHEIKLYAKDLPSGIYFYRAHTKNHDVVKKMILIK